VTVLGMAGRGRHVSFGATAGRGSGTGREGLLRGSLRGAEHGWDRVRRSGYAGRTVGEGRSGGPARHAIAGRGKCLVILDNFEQVVGHAQATVGRWLERAASASFIVTSRERLLIAGEQVMPLEPLPCEGAGVELFVRERGAEARLRAHGREQAGGARDRASPGWSAARDRAGGGTDPSALAGAVAGAAQGSFPDPGSERVAYRHGSRRCARRSTGRGELLTPWEQRAGAGIRLRGGFTLEAAEAVLDLSPWPDAPLAMDIVQSLVDKSLLRRGRRGGGPGSRSRSRTSGCT